MKALLWTFLVITFLINFTVPFSALQGSSAAENESTSKDTIPSENELIPKIIAIVVIVIIALGTVGIVILVIVKGGKKKNPKEKRKPVVPAEEPKSEPLSSPEEDQIQDLPEAELRDLSQVTDKDSLEVKVPITSIGREYGNDIIIPKNTVSSRHATIEYRNGYFYLVDHRSSNGTFINGTKISGEAKLKSGDLLAFDVFKFQFIVPTLTAFGQPHGQKKSQYSTEDSGMTILRPQRTDGSGVKSKAISPQKSSPSGNTQKKDFKSPPKSTDVPPSGEGPRTMLKPRTCPNHPEWWATKTCSLCKGVFCIQCVSEKNGRAICNTCEKKGK